MNKYHKLTSFSVFMLLFLLLSCFLAHTTLAKVLEGEHWMVASRYSEAAEAGALILQQGGNAFDAAVSVLAASGVVDPLHSGLGAEVFALVYSVEDEKVIAINGAGQAPRAATIDRYQKDKTGETSPLIHSLIPGALDVWVTLMDEWGTLTLNDVLLPAIELAEGWTISPMMADVFARKEIKEKLSLLPGALEIYYKENGNPYQAGEMIDNRYLANTLKRVVRAEKSATTVCPCRGDNNRHQAMFFGRNQFYTLQISGDFNDYMKNYGGWIDYNDLAFYRGKPAISEFNHALIESPAHLNYHGYDIYTCASASSGPVALESLHMIGEFESSALGHNTTDSVHLMAQAMILSLNDQADYLGDFNFINAPLNGLLSDQYAVERVRLIDWDNLTGEWSSGNPYFYDKPPYDYDGEPFHRYGEPPEVNMMYHFGVMDSAEESLEEVIIGEDIDLLLHQSNYVCAADKWGNLVYATTTLTSPFGSGAVVKPLGFFLNSGMERFSLNPNHPNALAPGKRPIGFHSPTIVCKEGKPYLAFGSSNGEGGFQTSVQTIVNIIDHQMDIEEAMNAPMWRFYYLPASKAPFTANPGVLSIDKRLNPETIKELEEMGWKITIGGEFRNNPDCIVIIDQEQSTLKVAATSNKASTMIAR